MCNCKKLILSTQNKLCCIHTKKHKTTYHIFSVDLKVVILKQNPIKYLIKKGVDKRHPLLFINIIISLQTFFLFLVPIFRILYFNRIKLWQFYGFILKCLYLIINLVKNIKFNYIGRGIFTCIGIFGQNTHMFICYCN